MTINLLFKYGATLMEVDVDGSLSYPEAQMTAKDTGNVFSTNLIHFSLNM